MSRIEPSAPEQYEPLFGAEAPLRQQIYAHAPALAAAHAEYGRALRTESNLEPRLTELVRLRVAFHNQCRSCMSVRYSSGTEDGVTEDLVCSLERPAEADDLSDRERAALVYADLLATDHFAIDDETFAELRRHFSDAEIVELGFHIALYVGGGRVAMALDMVEDLPDGYRGEGRVAPWGQPETVAVPSS